MAICALALGIPSALGDTAHADAAEVQPPSTSRRGAGHGDLAAVRPAGAADSRALWSPHALATVLSVMVMSPQSPALPPPPMAAPALRVVVAVLGDDTDAVVGLWSFCQSRPRPPQSQNG